MAMAMAVTSTSTLHLSLPLRCATKSSPGAQIRGFPQGLVRRAGVSRRSLAVRAAENDPSSEAERQRLDELEVRLGVGRKSRREGRGAAVESSAPATPRAPAKAWDDMSLPEKAWEIYVGETGLLFWLNKLAYASIFLIAGGWIIFRFIGPALGWYQLDQEILPPSQVLSGTVGR